jgi:hypothetical protein
MHDIRSNNSNSGYSNHILNTGHAYGTIADTMEMITTGKKGKYFNTLERYHIVTCSGGTRDEMTGSGSDDWVY